MHWKEKLDNDIDWYERVSKREVEDFIKSLLIELIDSIPDNAARMDLLKDKLKSKYLK